MSGGATGTARPHAAVLSFSPLHRDARVQRQIRALTAICRVTAFGLTDPGIAGVRFVDVSQRPKSMPRKALKALLLKMGRFEAVYRSEDAVRRAADALKGRDFALIVANDIDTLPLALDCRGRGAVLFDAHEYAPREFEEQSWWRFFMQTYQTYLCTTCIPRVDAMTTVGPRIAEEYAHEFGVRPSIIWGAPHYRAGLYAARDGDIIRMVHHGGAVRSRHLEIMIDAMARLDDRFRLDLILVPGDVACIASLKKRASSDSRVSFPSPVEPDEIVDTLSDYDVGLCSFPPSSFNLRHTLPNKFFDFIQARLCTAIGPTPEMKTIVEQYSCGVVATDFTAESLARTLRTLDRATVEACRRAADAAAADLCFERSAEVLLAIARRLLEGDGAGRAGRDAPAPQG